ncbi:MAG: RIP metalloprotease RseP [Oxalobacteraceae bacterium]
MELLHTVTAFIIVIGVLVTIHEFGHYLVARWCGVKVLKFSVGLGKPIWSRRVGPDQTEWAIAMVPLGGYVKMLDARADDAGVISEADLTREFTRQVVWKRIAIVAAGPLANFLLAIAIFSGLYLHGVPEAVSTVSVQAGSLAERAGLRSGDTIVAISTEPVTAWSEMRWRLLQAALRGERVDITFTRPGAAAADETLITAIDFRGVAAGEPDQELMSHLGLQAWRPPARLGEVIAGGPASKAGLQPGDILLSVDGQPVTDALAFIERVQAAPGRTVQLELKRQSDYLSVEVTPAAERVGDRSIGRIMAQMDLSGATVIVSSGPLEAMAKATKKVWETSSMTLSMLGKMLTGEASLKNITGPLTIADYAGQTARIGLISFLSFMAFISISLGVMNLLPIPVLDGGHLLYYSLELFSGRPVPERVGHIAQRAGLGILMALMTVALFNDIVRLVW